MKELSIEDKAKAYDEALKVLHKYDGANIMFTQDLKEEMFPELKESDDEMIRKSLIILLQHFCKGYRVPGLDFLVSYKDMIAWLEKQGESRGYLSKDEEYTLARIIEFIEDNDCPDEWKSLLHDIYSLPYQKQGEQKPIDKVEPKFHKGDWVVYECGEETAILQITRIVGETYVFSDDSTLSVVDEDALRLWDITKDAKDGDVLNSPTHRLIWIYKDNEHYHACVNMNYVTENVVTDGLISISNDACPATKDEQTILFAMMKEAGYEWDAEKKELRKVEQEQTEFPNGEDYGIDGLYHAISILEKTLGQVEGYQSDDGILEHKCAISAVKQLYEQKPADTEKGTKGNEREIPFTEQKPAAWSEEDEEKMNWIIATLNNCSMRNSESLPMNESCEDWLESLRPQNWTKEDKERYINCLQRLGTGNPEQPETINSKWFKEHVYPQSTWKPSNEQMEALEHFIVYHNGSTNYAKDLEELRLQLKKLMEK